MEWLFNSFKAWYMSGIATDEDLEIVVNKGALTRAQVDEIKQQKQQ